MATQSITAASAPAPQERPAEKWISHQELVRVIGWSDRHIRRLVAAGDLQARDSGACAPNGRPILEYLFSSLPESAQRKLSGTPPTNALVPVEPLFANLASPDRVALPDPRLEAQANERLDILQPIVLYNRAPERYASLRLADGTPVTSETRMIAYIAEQSGVSVRTLKEWKRRYREGGLPALADLPRSDKGTSRFFTAYPKAAMVAAWLYLEHRQRPRTIYESLCANHAIIEVPESDLPSYETVRAWLSNPNVISPAMRTLAREGRRAYQEAFAAYIRRGYTDVYAGDCLVSDHMICDVEVRNTLFPEQPWGTPIRLRMTTLLDFRSRYVAGVSFCWEGSSRSITTALRHAIALYGPPLWIYADNGKDYQKAAKGAIPAYLRESPLALAKWHERELAELTEKGVLARLGIMAQHCLPFHPQSKHVERYHKTYHERFDALWTEHYTSGSPATRPDVTAVSMAEHRKLLKHGLAHLSTTPTDAAYIELALQWIAEYNHRPMGENAKGMEGLSPAEVFASERNPERRERPDAATLALMLAERKSGVMVREFSVTHNKQRYVVTDREAMEALAAWGGREVDIAYDPNDRDAVALLTPDGFLICWAQAEEFLPQSPAANELVKESMANRRHIERKMRDALTGLNRAVRQIGGTTPLEDLKRRAEQQPALPAAVGEVLTFRPAQLSSPSQPGVTPRARVECAEDVAEQFLEMEKE